MDLLKFTSNKKILMTHLLINMICHNLVGKSSNLPTFAHLLSIAITNSTNQNFNKDSHFLPF